MFEQQYQRQLVVLRDVAVQRMGEVQQRVAASKSDQVMRRGKGWSAAA
jgi:hypothetical protein